MATPQIEHVVVLMLENRSFDSMLGWLYQNQAPTQFLPAGTTPTFDGLQAVNLGDFNNAAENPRINAWPIQGAQGFTVPTVDPGEEFAHVTQQLFDSAAYPPTSPANMLGYLQDYVNVLQALGVIDSDEIPIQAPQVMQTYTPDQLPVLNQLAQAYAVSDAWYASVPSQTNPNRAFLMCGTSLGLVNNGQLETNPQAQQLEQLLGMAIGDDQFQAQTIFNALSGGGKDWAVFWQTSYLPEKILTLMEYGAALAVILTGVWAPVGAAIDAALLALGQYLTYIKTLTDGELESCYTWRLFPQIQGLPNAAKNFQSLDQFYKLAEAGKLPAFSYIEPYWTISQVTTPSLTQLPKALITALGNDYHPPSNLLVGEAFVKAVYTSLIANQAAWQKTLLLITFDEFVGTFDHQTEGLQQGLVQPPWGTQPPPPLAVQNNFNFDRLGARVPAIVVSPWVQAGTVFRSPTATPYDHTSMIATTLKLFGLSDKATTFGARTAAAPTFETVMTLTTPRTDAASLPFVDKAHKSGDPVNYGDTFLLQNQNGHYLTAFSAALKAGAGTSHLPSGVLSMAADIGFGALFPTLGEGASAPMSFLTIGPGESGQVPDQAVVYLISRETGLGASNALGAWNDSHDCYYFTPYFSGSDGENQSWQVQNQSGTNKPLCFGDKVILINQGFEEQGLSHDTRWLQGSWISTSTSPDTWTVQPAPVVKPS